MQQKCYHPSPFMVNLNVTIKSHGFLMLNQNHCVSPLIHSITNSIAVNVPKMPLAETKIYIYLHKSCGNAAMKLLFNVVLGVEIVGC